MVYFTDYRGNPLLSGAPIKPLERNSCTKRKSGPDNISTGNTMYRPGYTWFTLNLLKCISVIEVL